MLNKATNRREEGTQISPLETHITKESMNRKLKRSIYFARRSWNSLISVVSDHRMDDRGSIPVRGKGFFL
jgi:hypothetical protein